MDCPWDEVWDQLALLPPDLYEQWSKGGGWNSAGSEAPAMRKWALNNMGRLRRPIRKVVCDGRV